MTSRVLVRKAVSFIRAVICQIRGTVYPPVLCLFRAASFEEQIIPKLQVTTDKRTVAVVLPCFNHLDYTQKALDSYLAARCPAFNHVLVVIDDHSTDNTRSFWLKNSRTVSNLCYFRYRRNMGLTQAWNNGVAFSSRCIQADYIVVINNDVIMPHNTIEKLTRHLIKTGGGMIGPMTNAPGHQCEQQIKNLIKEYVPSDAINDIEFISEALKEHKVKEVDFINGFFFAASRDIFEGNLFWKFPRPFYFNPIYRNVGNEDEFQDRLREKGRKIYKAEDAFVFHYKDVTLNRNFEKDTHVRRCDVRVK